MNLETAVWWKVTMNKRLILLMLLTIFGVGCLAKAEATGLNFGLIENFNGESVQMSVLPTPKTKKTFDIHQKIGIADVSDKLGCLRTKNGDLAEKTPVSIIISFDYPPLKILTATVGKRLYQSCARRDSETGDKNPGENYFYSLILTEKFEDYDVGIAVIQPTKQIQVKNNLASIDLNEDGKLEYFRRCTSFEGLYFNIWTGKPFQGKRIWDSFYYLDYDTKKDCKKKDYERN